MNEIFQQCVTIEQGITIITTTREDYLNTSYSIREFKRDHPSQSKYERSHEEERERKIEKKKIEKSLSRVKPDIDINCFSTENTNECLIQKEEEEETHKE